MKKPLTPAEVLKREEAKAAREALESALALALRAHKLTDGMVRQYRPFEDIGYSFDFAWPDLPTPLLVEVNGGLWSAGAHARPQGIKRDWDKSNRANLAGYCCLAISADDIRTGKAIELIRQAMTQETTG